jgi:hypothetical protein
MPQFAFRRQDDSEVVPSLQVHIQGQHEPAGQQDHDHEDWQEESSKDIFAPLGHEGLLCAGSTIGAAPTTAREVLRFSSIDGRALAFFAPCASVVFVGRNATLLTDVLCTLAERKQ